MKSSCKHRPLWSTTKQSCPRNVDVFCFVVGVTERTDECNFSKLYE